MRYYNLSLEIADKSGNLYPKLKFAGKQEELEIIRSQYSFQDICSTKEPFELSLIYDQDSENYSINDMLSWIGVLNTQYEVVSTRLVNILKEHQLGKHSFRKINIKSDEANALSYFIFQSLNNVVHFLDYQQSIFTEWKPFGNEKVGSNQLNISDAGDFSQTRKKLRKEKLLLGLHKLVLPYTIDWFQVPVLGHVVTEQLMEKINKSNISGLAAKEIEDIEFKISS